MLQKVKLDKLVILFLILLCNLAYGDASVSNSAYLKRIAILPLRNLSVGSVDETKIRNFLADALKNKENVQVINISTSDDILKENKFLDNKKIELDKLQQIGEILHADGLIFGNITTYHIPSQGEKSAGAIIPLSSAIAKVEVSLQLYDTNLRKIIWGKLITGYSKPFVLKIESLAVNIDSALDSLKKEFGYYWSKEVEKKYKN